ncbi:MAG: S-layer homology domain-containing protein [Clostridia bacterium]|nr:S-layer homology domain-containing protein [Clostridia bacterium]
MKQTTKRVLSMVLTLLMLVSAMSVFTFAENNFEPDDEYYDRIINDAVIVGSVWTDLSDGDEVSYMYRGKEITETFDSNIHFTSIKEAYDYCLSMNVKNPIIVITSGIYNESLTITNSVTILGANAGINPNVVSATPGEPWSVNPARSTTETTLVGAIDVARKVNTNIEVVLDGVTVARSFAYIDAGNKKAESSAVLRNSIVNGAGSTSYGVTAVTNVFYFASSVSSTNKVKIEDVRCTNMKSTSLVGTGTTDLEISGLYYVNNSYPALQYADAPADQDANYVIKDSMFYNNKSTSGVLAFDHSLKDTAQRIDTYVEISGCVFKDDPEAELSDSNLSSSPILYTVTAAKNRLNVHDNLFIGAADYSAPAINFSYTLAARTSAFSGNINVNSNKFCGFYNMNETLGLSGDTRMNYTGNYYADYSGAQHDPVYPSENSMQNIVADYFWIDDAMTIPSDIFHLNSTGINNASIDHVSRTIKATIDYGDKAVINFAAKDGDTVYELYDETLTNKITEIDSADLYSGEDKNTFYAVGKSPKTGYEFRYTVILTTYNPNMSADFDLKDTYLLAPSVASLPAGSVVFETWGGMAYKFTVGVNAFATAPEIIAACDSVPTIIMPAGTYTEQIMLTGSAVLLGEKHGVNPNIPNYGVPDSEWEQNPERSQSDRESRLNSVIVLSSSAVNATVVVDGFTFAAGSGYVDRGEGLVTYTTTILKNIIINDAGNGLWTENGKTENLQSIFAFGASDDTYMNNHKDVRIVNLRMDAQGTTSLIDGSFETLIMDGVYLAGNSSTLNKGEWMNPKGQNFYLNIRNSFFFKNYQSYKDKPYLCIDLNTNDTDATTSKRIVMENTMFYNNASYPYGIFGVRFGSSKDSMRLVNNIFVSTTANALMPGGTNWFKNKVNYDSAKQADYDKDPSLLDKIEIVDDIEIKFNHIIATGHTVDMTYCKPGTKWNWNYNYFATSFVMGGAGKAPTIKDDASGGVSCVEASKYYNDWNMTDLNTDADDEFAKELDYSINGSGVVDTVAKTYTDTVSASTATYDFNIKMNTLQASYGVYSDAECQNAVSLPVTLKGGSNVFYIKFSSYKDFVSDVYTATITKPLGTEADIVRFGSWRVSDDAVYASIPVGTTEFAIPEIAVSNGATYEIFNDAGCTEKYDYNYISGIGIAPVFKFIKVVSEDGNVSKVYTLSVLQAENDQAEVTYIENAEKISDNEFQAVIPVNKYSFDIIAQHSDNAAISVYDMGQLIRPSENGIVTIDNIAGNKTVDIVVKSAGGAEKTFKLNIVKDRSSCNVTSVFGMINNGDDTSTFETRIDGNSFKVIAYPENQDASYAVYSDYACTAAFADNVVQMSAADTVAYLKVTSADGSASKIYTLNIHTSSEDFKPVEPVDPPKEEYVTIDNATLIADGEYTIKAEDNISSYDVLPKLLDNKYSATTYRVFADKNCSNSIDVERAVGEPTTVPVIGKYTNVYVKVYVKELAEGADTPTGVTDFIVKVTIDSNRPKATYADADAISGWAKEQVNFLNDNGFGYFQGDNGYFRPKDNITRFEVAAIAVRVLGIDESLYSNIILPYTDTIPDWASNYVKACFSLGIMTGVDPQTFDGKKPTTRQEFAKIGVSTVCIMRGDADDALTLYNENQEAIDAAYNERGFADEASVSNWAKPYMRLAVVTYGLINGSNDYGVLNLNPKKEITRQEVAVILANYNGYTKA